MLDRMKLWFYSTSPMFWEGIGIVSFVIFLNVAGVN